MQKISNPELIIGIIYSNNCIHCVELLPKWKKMKKNIKTKTNLNKIKHPTYLEIEANSLNKLDNFNNINRKRLGKDITYSGFPTVFKIYGNNVEYYEGSREPTEMENFFMKEKYSKNNISVNSHSHNKTIGGRLRKHANITKNKNTNKNKKLKKTRKFFFFKN